MNPGDDPDAELRRAWERLQAPASPAESTDDLERCDKATRSAVGWMRAAYDHIEIPAPALEPALSTWRRAYEACPIPPRPATPQPMGKSSPAPRTSRNHRPSRRLTVAIGFLALAAATLLLLLTAHGNRPGADTSEPKTVASADTPALAGEQPAEPARAPRSTSADTHAPPPVGLPAHLGPNGIELRSGPVRLILVSQSAPSDGTTSHRQRKGLLR